MITEKPPLELELRKALEILLGDEADLGVLDRLPFIHLILLRGDVLPLLSNGNEASTVIKRFKTNKRAFEGIKALFRNFRMVASVFFLNKTSH